jgi:hypothetical protein
VSFEQKTFRAFKAKFTADSTLVALVLPGAMIHAEELQRTRTLPRIEFSMTGQQATDASGTRMDSAVVRLGVFVKRDLAHGSGSTPEVAGQLEGIIDRIETTFNGSNAAGATITDSTAEWTFATIGRARILHGPSSDDVVHRVIEVLVHGEKA